MRILPTLVGMAISLAASCSFGQEVRETNNQQLAKYNDSGGWAYYHSKHGADPNGTELMVRRCNQPKLRVSLKPLFQMKGISKLGSVY